MLHSGMLVVHPLQHRSAIFPPPHQDTTTTGSSVVSTSSVGVELGTLFQECVNNFTVYMLLLQNATITKHYMRIYTIIKHNMRICILESGGLAKSNRFVVYKAILNSI